MRWPIIRLPAGSVSAHLPTPTEARPEMAFGWRLVLVFGVYRPGPFTDPIEIGTRD